MEHGLRALLLPLALIMVMGSSFPSIHAESIRKNNKLKTATFLSPMFTLTPGAAQEKFYYDIDFPKGHIGMKSFFAEVVDEEGRSVPLYDTYLHHWTVVRYYQHRDIPTPDNRIPYCDKLREPGFIYAGSKGTCQPQTLPQFYGIGSETRRTSTYIQDPYAIELGNPEQVPPLHEEKWVLNVHAIDTRGVEDKLKCMECWCDYYNVTVDQSGKPLDPDYTGGMKCCYDKTQCRMSKSYKGNWEGKNLYMKYVVTYQDWDDSLLPVKVYLIDVTDLWSLSNPTPEHSCQIEYSIDACNPTYKDDDKCLATKRLKMPIPYGGYFVYGSAHMHNGAINATMYGEDGRAFCTSTAIYGNAHEVGNEDGYLVGVTHCDPKPGSYKIKDGEVLTLESNYAPGETHKGVMGVFNVMVSEKLPPETSLRMELSELVGETNE